MTTSTSNASVAVHPQGSSDAERLITSRTPTADAVARTSQVETTPPRTLWSRFIILVLCLAIVLSTIAFGTVHTWSLAVFQAGAALIVALWMVDAWRSQTLRLSRNFLQWPLLAFFFLGLVQTLPLGSAANLPAGARATISFDPYTTRFVLIQVLSLFIYFAAALAFIDTPKRLRLIVRTIIIFGFLLALFGMMQFFINPSAIFWIRELKQSVPFGPYINRHHFAGYMELTLAIPLGLLFTGAIERDRMPLYGFAALLMGIALAMTNSRGGMLSLVAEILFLLTVTLGGRRNKDDEGKEGEDEGEKHGRVKAIAKRALLGVGIIALVFFSVIFFGGEESLSRLVGSVNADDPTTGRTHFWAITLEIIRQHPILGIGLGAFSVVYTRYDTGGGLMRLEQAHNDYLQILSDAGIVGGLLGLLFVIGLFRMAFARAASKDKFRRGVCLGALAGCFAVLVHSLFDFTLHTTANALLFLVLAALATLNGRVEEAPKRRGRRRRRRHRHGSSGQDAISDEQPSYANAAPESDATPPPSAADALAK